MMLVVLSNKTVVLVIVLLVADGMGHSLSFAGTPECDHAPRALMCVARCHVRTSTSTSTDRLENNCDRHSADVSLRVLVRTLSAIRMLGSTSHGVVTGGAVQGRMVHGAGCTGYSVLECEEKGSLGHYVAGNWLLR